MEQRIIATWNTGQNPDVDPPAALRLASIDADGCEITSEVCPPELFARIDGNTQSDPYIEYGPDGQEVSVEFSYTLPRA